MADGGRGGRGALAERSVGYEPETDAKLSDDGVALGDGEDARAQQAAWIQYLQAQGLETTGQADPAAGSLLTELRERVKAQVIDAVKRSQEEARHARARCALCTHRTRPRWRLSCGRHPTSSFHTSCAARPPPTKRAPKPAS